MLATVTLDDLLERMAPMYERRRVVRALAVVPGTDPDALAALEYEEGLLDRSLALLAEDADWLRVHGPDDG